MKKKLAKQNLKKENEDSEENLEEDSNDGDEGETLVEVEEPEVPKFDKKGSNIRSYLNREFPRI